MIYPLHLNMLIRPTTNSVSPGGIHLATSTVDGFQRGTIIEMGDGEYRAGCGFVDVRNPDVIATEGDEVYFTGGAPITDPDTGETFVLVHYNNLVAMISREQTYDRAEESDEPAEIPSFGGFTDWIPWSGGECPVDGGALVMVVLRCEVDDWYLADPLLAGCWCWGHAGDDYDAGGDIVYYRIV